MRRTLVVVALAASFPGNVRADDAHVARGPLAADDGVRLSGTFRSEVPGPVAVTLTRWKADESGFGGLAKWGAALRLDLADGDAYRFEGLVPGEFSLAVAAPGLGPLPREMRDVAVFRDTTLDVRARRDCVVRCRVALGFAGDAGKISAAARQDHADGFVTTEACGSAENGIVRLSGLAPSRYRLTAEFDERAGLPSLERGGEPRTSAEVDLAPGERDVALEIPAPVAVRLACHAAGKREPIEGVLRCREDAARHVEEPFHVSWSDRGVRWREGDEGRIAGMDYGPMGACWGNPADDIAVRGLAKGTWTFAIDAVGFAPWERRVEVAEPAKIDAVLVPLPGNYVVLDDAGDERIDVDVRPAAGGAWTPLVARNDRPVFSDAGQTLTGRHFLAPGPWLVSATTRTGAPTPPRVVEASGDRSRISLSFAAVPGRTLRARTTSRAGVAVDGFEVHCLVRDRDAWRPLRAKKTAAIDGGFTIRGLPRGAVRLAFDEAGEFPIGDVEIGDEDVEREFVVPAPATSK